MDAPLPQELFKAFGSRDGFKQHVQETVMAVKTPRRAWLVYDRIHEKVKFFTEKSDWQPNLEQYEPLLCYPVNP